MTEHLIPCYPMIFGKMAACAAFSIAMGEDPEADESIDRAAHEPMERARVSSDPTPPPQDRYTRASQPTQASAPSDAKRLTKTLNPAECLEALTEFGVLGASQRVDFSRGFFACEDADQRVLWKAIKDRCGKASSISFRDLLHAARLSRARRRPSSRSRGRARARAMRRRTVARACPAASRHPSQLRISQFCRMLLHQWQHVTRFDGWLVPPRVSGTT